MKRIVFAAMVVVVVGAIVTADEKKAQVMFQAAIAKETLQGDLKGAIAMFENVVAEAGVSRGLAAQALVRMAECYQKLGDAQASKIYDRIVREFADQKEAVTLARARLGGAPGGIGANARGDRAVWTGPYVDLFGQVSPDGRFITFTDWVRSTNLMVHDVARNTDRALTGAPSSVNNPSYVYQGEAEWSAISKDGKYVAYGWLDVKDGPGIRVVDLESAGPPKYRQLLTLKSDEVRFLGAYDWSADGKWIAVQTQRTDGTSQIGLVAVADGTLRVLKTAGWTGPERLFFSPDGRSLAYDLPAGDTIDQRDVFVLAIDGSREIPAVVHPADDGLMGWSPDGSKLLFSSDRMGSTGLWAQPFVNGRPQGSPELLRQDIGSSSFSLGLTASGSLYVFKHVGNRDVHVAPIDLEAGRLSGPPQGFAHGFVAGARLADWSPDGKYLAYQARSGCDDCVAIRSLETGQLRRLPRTVLYPTTPRWSPDGKSFITAARDRRGRNGLFQLDAHSGAILWTLDGVLFDGSPVWSPDGSKIVFLRRGSGIIEHDLRTGAERQILKHTMLMRGEISLSPDGAYVVGKMMDAANKASSLLVVAMSGGEPRELIRVNDPNQFGRQRTIAWTPDRKNLLVARTVSSNLGLWLVPLDGSAPRKLDVDYENLTQGGLDTGFSLSRDGRSIAFLSGKDVAEVWALENILPPTRGTQR